MSEASYFEILGVDENASENEIRRAYARKIREYPPEKDPKNFQKIREAYEILMDPRTRAQYVETLKYNDYVREFEEKALQAMNEENYSTAASYLRRALDKAPSLDYLWNELGLCYANLKDYDKAKTIYFKLIQDYPDNSLYLSSLGAVLYELKDYVNSEKYFLRAIEQNPTDISSMFYLSRIYIEKNDYSKAANFLEKCVNIDGRIDSQDIYFLLDLLRIYALMNDKQALQTVIDRIEAVSPDDESFSEYIAYEIEDITLLMLENEHYDIANQLSEWALSFSSAEDFILLRDSVSKWSLISSEIQRMRKDYRLREVYKEYIITLLEVAIGLKDESGIVWASFTNPLSLDGEKFIRELKITKRNYREIYKLVNRIVDNSFKEILSENTKNKTSSFFKGCGYFAVILVGLFIAIVYFIINSGL